MNRIAIIILLLISSSLNAQVLTLEEAINIALKNSLDIQIAKNNVEANQINNHISVAGGVPAVTASVSDNQSLTNLSQELSSGTKINRTGTANNNINAGISGSFLVFNGFRVQAAKGRLAALERLSEEQVKAQIQNVISNVIVKYYDIVRQQSYMKTVEQSIQVTLKQKELADARKSVGLANNADVFQAQLDLNASRQELQTQQLILMQAKSDLMNLLTQSPDSSFEVRDTIIVDTTIALDSVRDGIRRNPELLSAEEQIRVNEYIVREVGAQRYPAVSVTGGYNYSRNQSSAGNFLLNQNFGPFVGFNVQVPIFNGGLFTRQRRVAEIDTRNAETTRELLLNNLETSAVKAWQAYTSTLQQLKLEQENNIVAHNLLQLTLQRYQYNQATIIEVREAQRSFVEAGYRLVNLAYAAKVAEVELKRLGNVLIL